MDHLQRVIVYGEERLIPTYSTGYMRSIENVTFHEGRIAEGLSRQHSTPDKAKNIEIWTSLASAVKEDMVFSKLCLTLQSRVRSQFAKPIDFANQVNLSLIKYLNISPVVFHLSLGNISIVGPVITRNCDVELGEIPEGFLLSPEIGDASIIPNTTFSGADGFLEIILGVLAGKKYTLTPTAFNTVRSYGEEIRVPDINSYITQDLIHGSEFADAEAFFNSLEGQDVISSINHADVDNVYKMLESIFKMTAKKIWLKIKPMLEERTN